MRLALKVAVALLILTFVVFCFDGCGIGGAVGIRLPTGEVIQAGGQIQVIRTVPAPALRIELKS